MKWMHSSRHRTLPGWAHTEQYKTAINQIVQSLYESAPSLPGVRVEGAGDDPTEPEFYVVTCRVPGDERGAIKPVTLFYILSPNWLAQTPSGEIVYIAAIGHSAASISVRRFLRTWHAARIGGKVIYEGDFTEGTLPAHAGEAFSRFLEQREEVATKDDAGGTISVWPLAVDFRSRLCNFCLLPAAHGVCPKCGKSAIPGRFRRRFS